MAGSTLTDLGEYTDFTVGRVQVSLADPATARVRLEALISYDSPSIERLLRYHAAERLGTAPLGYVHPDHLSLARDRFTGEWNAGSCRPPTSSSFASATGRGGGWSPSGPTCWTCPKWRASS